MTQRLVQPRRPETGQTKPPLERSTAPPAGEAYNVRTSDGTYNDLTCPRMGNAGMRFGRNVPS